MHITHGAHMHTLLIMITHSHVHTRVYKCTHCGRKGHLAKFYFDKINHINLQIIIFGLHLMLTPVDPKENGYQNPHLLCLM